MYYIIMPFGQWSKKEMKTWRKPGWKKSKPKSAYAPLRLPFRSGVPKAHYMKLRYCQLIQIDPPQNGIPAQHTFSANGLWKPSITGGTTAHQPYLFDTYCGGGATVALYNHYTVLSSMCTAQFNSTEGGTGYIGMVGIFDTTGETIITPSYDLERPGTVWKSIGLSTGGHGVVKIRKSYNTKSYFHVKDAMENRFQGNGSMNPIEGAYFYIIASPTRSTSNPGPIDVLVTIEYNVVFQEFNMTVAQS